MKNVHINSKILDGDTTLFSFIVLLSPVKDCWHFEKVQELCESTYLLMLSMQLALHAAQALPQNVLLIFLIVFNY